MPFKKIKDMADIYFWLMFIGVMAVFREYCQFASRKMAIKVHSLFHLKEKTPARINDQGRTAYYSVAKNGKCCRTEYVETSLIKSLLVLRIW